jgi:putative hemolysin
MAFVVDEYGELQGLVTLHDVLEAITGQFDASTEDSEAVRRADGSWLLDGQIPLTQLPQYLPVEWPDPNHDVDADFETISGLIFWQLGRIPRTGDSIRWQGWTLEVVDMDGQRIDKVLASPAPARTS